MKNRIKEFDHKSFLDVLLTIGSVALAMTLALLIWYIASRIIYPYSKEEEWEPNYNTVVIDSCEYIYINKRTDITHKGNCRFCGQRKTNETKTQSNILKK